MKRRFCFAAIALLASAKFLAQAQETMDGTRARAWQLRNAGKLPEAEVLLQSALTNRRQSGADDVSTANLINDLGIVLQDEGKFLDAEACFRRATSDFEVSFGPQHAKFAIALANLGGVLTEEGRYQEAYRLIRRAIDIASPVLGDCDPAVAVMYSGLEHLFYCQREIARALPIARRSLACLEKEPGAETKQVGGVHNDLAALYVDDGQYSLAQQHLDRANAIWEKLLPPNHPDVLYGKNTQVALYYKQGRYKEARELGVELVEQAQRTLGFRHPSIAVILANIGYSDQKLKLYQESAECFQQAIAIEQAVNSHDPYLAELLGAHAAVLRQLHRKLEARSLESRAKAIRADSIR
jgi:tetratricopeptide (TPR) repeat protein